MGVVVAVVSLHVVRRQVSNTGRVVQALRVLVRARPNRMLCGWIVTPVSPGLYLVLRLISLIVFKSITTIRIKAHITIQN